MPPPRKRGRPSKAGGSQEYASERISSGKAEEEGQEVKHDQSTHQIVEEEVEMKTIDQHLDVESIEPEYIEDVGNDERIETITDEANATLEQKASLKKRRSAPENIDHSAVRYYDRYKNQDYVKRNDVSKYCQICKKKVFGKLRSLPSEHRLRRIWILRLNLDAERSAELWVREAFSDATHCGEACPIHFPIGTEHLKNRELLPIDMRQDPDSYLLHEDETFDFDSLDLECIFCDTKNVLRNMVPFSRTRSRRYKWINALAGEQDSRMKEVLQERLKNGASKFLCDWHFSDHDFDINQFGEWRLRKDALPDPSLCEADKQSNRVYMINHGDTILSRSIDARTRREDILFMRGVSRFKDRDNYRYLADKMRRTYPRRMMMYDHDFNYDPVIQYDGEVDPDLGDGHDLQMHNVYLEPGTSGVGADEAYGSGPANASDGTGAGAAAAESRVSELFADGEYSDDSDEEMEALQRVEMLGVEPLCSARFCQVCSRVVSSEKSMKEHKPRTWPFDDVKHEKWLELMNWPRDFEESMRVLWVKRRNDFVHNGTYHFCPINVCQSHLDFRNLYEKVAEWLSTYCILCDEDLRDPNLLLPFPADRSDRLLWLHNLVSGPPINKLVERRWKWLRDRLTRPKSTRYRACVYHFSQDSFVEKEDCIEFNEASIPLPLGLSEYDVTPRGPQGLVKCPLCDMWGNESQLLELRPPASQAERILLVEMFSGDKTLMKKGVEQLAMHPCKVCKAHLPNVDPYCVIAERRLVGEVHVQCIQCNNRDTGANMVPFPWQQEKKRNWVDAICRDHFTRTRMLKRLEIEGRHYLCTAHFHKNSLRYIPGLGVWKRFVYMPLACTAVDRERLVRTVETEPDYQPLLISGLDDEGVVNEVTYEEVANLLGDDMEAMFAQDSSRDRPLLSSQYELRTTKSNPLHHTEGMPYVKREPDHDEEAVEGHGLVVHQQMGEHGEQRMMGQGGQNEHHAPPHHEHAVVEELGEIVEEEIIDDFRIMDDDEEIIHHQEDTDSHLQ